MGQPITADRGHVFTVVIEDMVPVDHPVRFIQEFVDCLDLEELGIKLKVRGEPGTNFYCERLLLSIWLYGYFERVRSSRKLEKSVKSDIYFMWLAGTLKPDYSSLARFWAENTRALRAVFKRTVLVADEMGMIEFALMAVDGTKGLARSSRRTMWSTKSLTEKEGRLDKVIAELEKSIGSDTASGDTAAASAALADKHKLREEIRAKLALLKEQGRKHMHPGEPQARVMKNQRTNDLCYNGQAVADSKNQIVTAADVTTDENDQGQLVPMIDQVVENLGRAAEETLSDSGYATEEQLGLAEQRKYAVLTTAKPMPQGQEDRFRSDLFHYDPEKETVECPVNGTLLKFEREKERQHTGLMVKIFRCRNKDCPLRTLCSKEKRGKSVEVGPNRVARQNQTARQKLPESKAKTRQRAGIIEPIFALTKVHAGFTRFTYLGLEGAKTQWAMVMASHNLRKIFQKWQETGFKKAA